MIKRTLTLLVISLIMFNCNNRNDVTKILPYQEVLDGLVMKYTTVENLAKLTKVPSQIIVGIEIGIYNESPKLTEYLNKLYFAYENNDLDAIKSLKSVNKNIEYNTSKVRLATSIEDLSTLELNKNSEFQLTLNQIIVKHACDKITQVIENEFSFWRSPKIIWSGFFYSDEKIDAKWTSLLNNQISEDAINQFTEERINAYTTYLKIRHKLIGTGNLKINLPQQYYKNVVVALNESLRTKIVSRLRNEAKETATDLLIELLSIIIIGLILKKIMNNQLKKITGLHDDIDKLLNKSNNVWIKGIGGAINASIKSFRTNKAEIKYKKYKRRSNFIINILSLVVFYFFFTKDNINIENNLNTELRTEYAKILLQHDFTIVQNLNTYTFDFYTTLQ